MSIEPIKYWQARTTKNIFSENKFAGSARQHLRQNFPQKPFPVILGLSEDARAQQVSYPNPSRAEVISDDTAIQVFFFSSQKNKDRGKKIESPEDLKDYCITLKENLEEIE